MAEINDMIDMIDSYEPPNKKMRYEETSEEIKEEHKNIQVKWETGYITKKGNILLEYKEIEDSDDNSILLNSRNKPFEMNILNVQSGEGFSLYLISDILQIDINKSYSVNEIFTNFMNGDYLLGTLEHYYKYNYDNGIIDNVSKINDYRNSEVKLHYTQPRCYEGNVAWRTIYWDLFEEFVPK